MSLKGKNRGEKAKAPVWQELLIYLPNRSSIKIRPELLGHRVRTSHLPSRADSVTTELTELVLLLPTCLGTGLASEKTEKKAHK